MNRMHIIEKEKILKAFGAFIREGRLKKGLSQEDVATQVDIKRTYYTLIEAGQRQLYFALALNICRVLDLDIGKFMNQLK